MTKPTDAPTARDRLLFAALLAVFLTAIGWLAPGHPSAFFGMAGFIATATCIALALTDESPRSRMALGFIPACALAGIGFLAGAIPDHVGVASTTTIGAAVGVGIALPAALFSPFGTKVYVRWMAAFRPVGWSVSFLLLAVVYYAILSPTGMLMRLVGRDPMYRRIDRTAKTYWTPRAQPSDARRYFRQS